MSTKMVLYIGTPIFNYYKKIKTEIEKLGYSVDYYNEIPSENSLIKGVIKIKRSLVDSLIQRYFDKIMCQSKSKTYDIIFIVNCKVFTPVMIKQLRDTQKSARFILYMWDSLNLYPLCKEVIPLFDKAYSFDSDDCGKIDNLTFLPLFFSREYEQLGQEPAGEKEYDIVSVCTAHPNRYKAMHHLFPELQAKGIRIFSYMFLNKLQYLYNKMFVSEFKGAKHSEFKFKPLSERENLGVLQRSDTVFDMQHNNQSGLTMRTIEALGAKRKIITSNANIKKYDFYNANNIFILNEHNLSEIELFLKNTYEPVQADVYSKYSLHSWVEAVINERNNNYLIE
ncbi:CgeB family protein [Candidatus Contubernalis alkaliaceticus]|uniref:hypothetical protein n=1 Tax=Candidatus Contubernalis alkaliaceticus TaxID=338645 RepID=UPI001F4C2AA0|nr:hypothetical protein [Candidatus Contubernalis alkalaceticus]UNC93565.1 hypothetical protein HUE98_16670 [Candidatus Contubernalis alkalaceticus]